MAEAFKVRLHVRSVVNVVQSDRRHQVTLRDVRSCKVGESLYLFFPSLCFVLVVKSLKKNNPTNSLCKVPL